MATCALLLALAGPAPGAAETRRPRIQVSIGAVRAGASRLGSKDATETQAPGGGRFKLFETETELEAAGGVEARLTYWLTPAVGLEAGGSWSAPRLATRITGDAEGAPGATSRIGVAQYVVDGGVVVRIDRLSLWRGRAVPFVFGGAGYLRQFDEDNVLVETGRIYQAGGGLLVWLRPPREGWLKRVGARADFRWAGHRGGMDLGCRCLRSFAIVGAAAVAQF